MNGNTRTKWPPAWRKVESSGITCVLDAFARIRASRTESCGAVIREGVVSLRATSWLSVPVALYTVEKRPFLWYVALV